MQNGVVHVPSVNIETLSFYLKFGDGDGPNLYRVKKKVDVRIPHSLKIYFGLG